jgi:hypothetical protein
MSRTNEADLKTKAIKAPNGKEKPAESEPGGIVLVRFPNLNPWEQRELVIIVPLAFA